MAFDEMSESVWFATFRVECQKTGHVGDVSGYDRIAGKASIARSQKVGKSDMTDLRGQTMTNTYANHASVQIPLIGTNLAIGGKWYEVMETVTKQDERGQFTTHCTIHELTDEGTYSDKPSVSVNLDFLDYTY